MQTGVEIALVLEVEEARHLLAVVILESGALVDGEHAWLTLFGLPASLHTEGARVEFLFHIVDIEFQKY